MKLFCSDLAKSCCTFLILSPNTLLASPALLAAHPGGASPVCCRKLEPGLGGLGGTGVKGPAARVLAAVTDLAARSSERFG